MVTALGHNGAGMLWVLARGSAHGTGCAFTPGPEVALGRGYLPLPGVEHTWELEKPVMWDVTHMLLAYPTGGPLAIGGLV